MPPDIMLDDLLNGLFVPTKDLSDHADIDPGVVELRCCGPAKIMEA